MRGSSADGAPSMNVSVPAVAPTTPPDMGASTKVPWDVAVTVAATSREVVGSMVEQSMKRREVWVPEEGGWERTWLKTDLTWMGSGRTVMTVSWWSVSTDMMLSVGWVEGGETAKDSEDWLCCIL